MACDIEVQCSADIEKNAFYGFCKIHNFCPVFYFPEHITIILQ